MDEREGEEEVVPPPPKTETQAPPPQGKEDEDTKNLGLIPTKLLAIPLEGGVAHHHHCPHH